MLVLFGRHFVAVVKLNPHIVLTMLWLSCPLRLMTTKKSGAIKNTTCLYRKHESRLDASKKYAKVVDSGIKWDYVGSLMISQSPRMGLYLKDRMFFRLHTTTPGR